MCELKPEESEKTANLLKTIAHPVRVGILELLENKERCQHKLYEQLECSQSMMSPQIRILRNCELIACRKDGTSNYCTIRIGHLPQLIHCARNCLFEKTNPHNVFIKIIRTHKLNLGQPQTTKRRKTNEYSSQPS